MFTRAAKSALVAWRGNYDEAPDLVNDLWVWYLERPSVQKKIETSDDALIHTLVRKAALQILVKRSLDDDTASGRSPYSSENIKDALSGVSKNRYLLDILPMAMDALDKQNARQAESIRSRYTDDVVPTENAAQQVLKRAVKSLTEHVNVIAITAGLTRDADGVLRDRQGPGSKAAVFPETRKAQGDGHSDPTANMAIALIEHPELRDEYLYEPSLPEFLGGRGYAESA